MLISLMLLACSGESPEPAAQPAPEPAAAPATAPEAPAAPEAAATSEDGEAPTRRVFFVTPADGASVTSPVTLSFGVENLVVEKAGQVTENHGHHHLIINGGPIEEGKIVPKDETHIHYGDGQTEAEVTLDPGSYTLTMQFADGNHMSYGKVGAAEITITVTE